MPNYLEGLDDHYMRVCVKAPIEQKTENAKSSNSSPRKGYINW